MSGHARAEGLCGQVTTKQYSLPRKRRKSSPVNRLALTRPRQDLQRRDSRRGRALVILVSWERACVQIHAQRRDPANRARCARATSVSTATISVRVRVRVRVGVRVGVSTRSRTVSGVGTSSRAARSTSPSSIAGTWYFKSDRGLTLIEVSKEQVQKP